MKLCVMYVMYVTLNNNKWLLLSCKKRCFQHDSANGLGTNW